MAASAIGMPLSIKRGKELIVPDFAMFSMAAALKAFPVFSKMERLPTPVCATC
jgi:hypothetical protein